MASPLCATTPVMKALDGLILSRSVHHLNLCRGAGYPLPIKLTQKLSFTEGVSR